MDSMKRRRFHHDLILVTVRWHLAYPLSYRDLEEMMQDRGIDGAHTTIYRWVQAYIKSIRSNFNLKKRPVSKSWRMDETYIKVRGKWKYLYRAVDIEGRTIDFMLPSKRDRTLAASFPS